MTPIHGTAAVLLGALSMLLGLLPVGTASGAGDVVEEAWEDGARKARYEVVEGPDGQPVREGRYQSWHPNGKEWEEGRFERGERTGEWVIRWESGKRRASGRYESGWRTGPWKLHRENGKKEWEGSFERGERSGEWTWFDERGKADPARSVVHESAVHESPAGLRWRGRSESGLPTGEWRIEDASGAPLLIGRYERGVPHGEWRLYLGDGSFVRDWVSGRYEEGQRVGDVAAPDEDPGGADAFEPLPCTEERARALERWLEGDGGPPPGRGASGDEALDAFAAGVNALFAVDLSSAAGRARARRIHDELLASPFGPCVEWPADEDEPGIRRLAWRWRALWQLLWDQPALWIEGLRPDAELTAEHLASFVPRLPRGGRWERVPPGAATEPTGAFGGKFGGRRNLRASGGTGTTEPLQKALGWLAARQGTDGSWAAPGASGPIEVARTAEVALALLGDGHTILEGRHRDQVRRALAWLVGRQDPDGGACHGEHEAGLYEHAIATQALIEGAYFGGNPVLRRAARRALGYLLDQRLPDGSWSAARGGREGDPLTTTSALLCLLGARDAGLLVDPELDPIGAWWDARSLDAGRVEGSERPALSAVDAWGATALAVFCDRFLRRSPKDAVCAARVAALRELKAAPARGSELQWVAYAAFQVGGDLWPHVNELVKAELIGTQQPDGSWRGDGSGDPLLATARRALALEVYFRFGRL